MSRRERILRAAAAITGGLWLALDHLRGDTPDMTIEVPVPPRRDPCPMCDTSLTEGPHFHGQDVYWPGEHGAILMTDLAGGDEFLIPGGAE